MEHLFCLSTYLLLVFLFLFLYSKFYGRCHLTVDVPFFYILLFGAFHSLSLIVQPVISRITVLVIDFRIGTGKSQLSVGSIDSVHLNAVPSKLPSFSGAASAPTR